MKKLIFSVFMGLLFFIASLSIDVSGAGKAYQIVDLYLCDESLVLAEMQAKSAVSRKELYVVSYCTCEGMNADMKTAVTRSKCEAPKNMVYSCNCIGKSTY